MRRKSQSMSNRQFVGFHLAFQEVPRLIDALFVIRTSKAAVLLQRDYALTLQLE
jgi:hypothetical protein